MGLARNELFEPLVAGSFARSRVRAQNRAGTERPVTLRTRRKEKKLRLGVSHGNPLMNILKGRALSSLFPLFSRLRLHAEKIQ